VAIGKRLEECGLKLNLQKSAIVYCKDSRRPEAHVHKQLPFLATPSGPRGAKKSLRESCLTASYPREFGGYQEDAAHDQELESCRDKPRPASESWRPVTIRYCEDG